MVFQAAAESSTVMPAPPPPVLWGVTILFSSALGPAAAAAASGSQTETRIRRVDVPAVRRPAAGCKASSECDAAVWWEDPPAKMGNKQTTFTEEQLEAYQVRGGQDGGRQLDVLQRGVKGGEVSAFMAQQNADHIRSASCCWLALHPAALDDDDDGGGGSGEDADWWWKQILPEDWPLWLTFFVSLFVPRTAPSSPGRKSCGECGARRKSAGLLFFLNLHLHHSLRERNDCSSAIFPAVYCRRDVFTQWFWWLALLYWDLLNSHWTQRAWSIF